MELVFFVDHACNLRCTYCYNGEQFSRRMPADVMKKGVDLGLSMRPRHIDLSLFGGEPLLHFDFVRELEAYIEAQMAALAGPKPTLRWLVNTNGTLFRDEILDWLSPPRLATVFVSLDGPRDVHDKYRLAPAGQGTYETILAGLERLRERQIAFQLVAVVNVETARRLGATVAELVELGATRVTLSTNFRDAWTDETIEGLRAGLDDAARVWIDLFRAGRQFPIDPLHTKILTHLKGGIPCPSRCLIAGKELCISPTGKIYACAQMVQDDRNDNLVIGTVDEGVDPRRVTALQSEKDRVETTCEPCALRDRCQSHCGCRHLALSGKLGEITATLCETEAAFIDAADRVAETLFAEQNPAFIDYYYNRPWTASAGGVLTQLRRARDV